MSRIYPHESALSRKYYSQPDPLCYDKELFTPVGRFLEGLISRSVVSRDALMVLFYHCYGLGPSQVARLVGLGMGEAQRVYKNFERWRQTGWQRTMDEIGMTDSDLCELNTMVQRTPARVNAEAERLVCILQTHYRKSEPDHYPCLSRARWKELFREDYGYDYRAWHLALCRGCITMVWDLCDPSNDRLSKPCLDLHVRPLRKGGILGIMTGERINGKQHGNGRTAQRVS